MSSLTWVPLGEVAEVISGQSPESKHYNNEAQGLPFYQGKKDFGAKFIDEPTVWTSMPTKIAHSGDILMSVRAPVGPVNIATQECCIGRGLAAIRPDLSKISLDYLFHFLQSIQGSLEGSQGSVFDSINGKQIREIRIPLRSQTEQLELVDKLDKAHAVLDAYESLERQKQKESSSLFGALLESTFQEIIAQYPLRPTSEILDVRDGTHDSPKFQKDGYPFVTSKNLKNGELDFSNVKYISKDDFEEYNKRSKVGRGDLLFGMIGTIGNPVVVGETPEFAIKNVALVKANSNYDLNFLRYYYLCPSIKRAIVDGTKGTTQKFVGLGNLRAFRSPDAPIEVQKKALEKFTQGESSLKKLEVVYAQKFKAIEELRNSVFVSLFSGIES